jgi:DNA polymerase phi
MYVRNQDVDIFADYCAASDAQRKATHFKNRVLDLVDIFLKTRATSPLAIKCILPLLNLVTGTGSDEKQLSDKATGIIRSRYGKQRESPSEVDVESTAETLSQIHARARKARSQDVLSMLSQCSLYLAKTLLAASGDVVVEAYKQSLTDFGTRKGSGLHGSFFQDFARRYPAEAWQLRHHILDVAGQAVNTYRACQIFQVVQVLLSQSSFIVNDLAGCSLPQS